MSPFHLSFSLLFYIVLDVKAMGLYFPGSLQSLPGLRDIGNLPSSQILLYSPGNISCAASTKLFIII